MTNTRPFSVVIATIDKSSETDMIECMFIDNNGYNLCSCTFAIKDILPSNSQICKIQFVSIVQSLLPCTTVQLVQIDAVSFLAC